MSALSAPIAATPLKTADTIGAFIRQGQRLTLRRPVMEDAETVHMHMADYGVVSMLSRAPWPYRLADAAGWLGGIEPSGHAGTAYSFAIVTGGRLIGVVGISAREDSVELGYWLGGSAWGQGYATEAARLALVFAFDELQLEEIAAGHFADNAASGRVLQKLGFAYTEDIARFCLARSCDVTCRMMILPRDRFQAVSTTRKIEGGPGHGR